MKIKLRFGLMVLLFFYPLFLMGGAWNNTLLGCRAMGMGGAFIAVANDPSAIFYNPAGLTRQQAAFNFCLGGFHIWPTHSYVSPTGQEIQSRFESSVPQIFVTYQMNEKVAVGFGVYIPYAGGGVDWQESDLGYPFKSTLGIISYTPTLAFKFNEKISIGFALNFYQGILTVKTKMDPLGEMKEEESGSVLTASAGLLYQLSEKAAFGLSLRGPAKMNLVGTTAVNYNGFRLKLDSETSFSLPWDLEAGLAYQLNDRILLSASAQYTLWSALDKIDKTIKNIPLIGEIKTAEAMNFQNILITRIGLEYAFLQGIFLRGGIGYDRHATPDESLNIMNIDVDKFSLLGGIGYRSGRVTIDFAYIYALGKEREKVLTGFGPHPLTEKYNLRVFILGLGLTYSF
ncbi:MAG: outer membrane protein transport protein [Candidatus Aminicenantes bacterium]|nr:outer membrane protein transport protein [Candidatus Aminicenantes bacterium]